MMSYIEAINISGISLVVGSAVFLFMVVRRTKWMSTTGKIEKSSISREVTEANSTYMGEYFISNQKIRSTHYQPNLLYSYVVDGHEYKGSKLFSVDILPLTASNLLHITSGSEVRVFYNPKSPNKSYLKSSNKWGSVIFLVLGFLLFQVSEAQIERLGDLVRSVIQS